MPAESGQESIFVRAVATHSLVLSAVDICCIVGPEGRKRINCLWFEIEMSDKHHWRIATATAPGSSHLRDDTPNQDAVAYRMVEVGDGEVVVVAVADGAGSASRSHEGSRIAVDAAVTAVVDGINRQPAAAFVKSHAELLLRSAIMQAKIEVERYGLRHNVAARELASTLIVAFASDSLVTAAQVGDGAVVTFNIGSAAAMTLCEAHSGEYANETTFITSRSRPHELAYVGHASGYEYDTLALITDGLQNLALKMPEREAFLGFWNPMLNDLARTDEPEAVPEKLHAFISGERVQSRTSDDVTIAIAVRTPCSLEENQQ